MNLRSRVAAKVVQTAGWPLPLRSTDRLRDLATYAMGIGSASLSIHESGEEALLTQLASRWSGRTEITLFDVGAHVGDYALAARGAFGQKATIHCFEPNPSLFGTLAPRVSDDAGISCHELAVGKDTGSATLFLDAVGSSRGSLIRDTFNVTEKSVGASHEVAVTTLDEFARENDIARIDLIKLDVEGHELAVLQGAARLLADDAIEVVQFEFGERNLASRTFLRDFWDLFGPRYEISRVTPRGLVPIEYHPQCEVFARETNYVAMRSGSGNGRPA